jgi:signal transduction histidine kinase
VAIVYDAALESDLDLVGAVGDATVLALENRRLGRELQRSVDDLSASRKRLVTAVASERRRIERDLHDGAQQQLLAVRVHLELARERPDVNPETAERLGALGADLDHALGELRSITHGIYPPLLAEDGLSEALAEAGRQSAFDVRVSAANLPRFPEEIEAAVYFTCLEALQNSVKHAGRGAACRLSAWVDGETLRFEVGDDGCGFSTGDGLRGAGLTNMLDRVGSLGGTLTVDSARGRGTLVTGALPIPSHAGA